LQFFVIKTLDLYPLLEKMLDPYPHLNQCGSETLSIIISKRSLFEKVLTHPFGRPGEVCGRECGPGRHDQPQGARRLLQLMRLHRRHRRHSHQRHPKWHAGQAHRGPLTKPGHGSSLNWLILLWMGSGTKPKRK
jgi:hypothetical protein